ncbi:hypothetical protein ACA910_006755 [Epithemia clementina (nom. ined.)]
MKLTTSLMLMSPLFMAGLSVASIRRNNEQERTEVDEKTGIRGSSRRRLYYEYEGSAKRSRKGKCFPLVAYIVNPAAPKDCGGGANVCGTVTFSCPEFESEYTLVTYEITGLTEGLHGMHIHELPVQDRDCASTAGHWNPEHTNHGSNLDDQRHIGDLGNILADAKGKASGSLLAYVPVLRGKLGIRGLSVVIHAGQDDLGRGGDETSRAVGNAGGRPGCGTIVDSEYGS